MANLALKKPIWQPWTAVTNRRADLPPRNPVFFFIWVRGWRTWLFFGGSSSLLTLQEINSSYNKCKKMTEVNVYIFLPTTTLNHSVWCVFKVYLSRKNVILSDITKPNTRKDTENTTIFLEKQF